MLKEAVSNDSMALDETTGRFVITERALLDAGIDLRARLAGRKATSPDKLIDRLVKTGSRMVYAFIHGHSTRNIAQDRAIASLPRLREIVFEALLMQTIYVIDNGDLSNSTKPEERAARFHPDLEGILDIPLPELGGHSILFTGVY